MKQVNAKRIRKIKEGKEKNGPVLYWMSRDQRIDDNWALLFAQEKAAENNQNLLICFCLYDKFPNFNLRNYSFLIEGLKKVEINARKLNIPFHVLAGNPDTEIPKYLISNKCSVLITDFSPLKIKRRWINEIAKKIQIPFFEVDAHNIVPVWTASDKQEYAARTIRPKINNKLGYFLNEFPKIEKQRKSNLEYPLIAWSEIEKKLNIEKSVLPAYWLKSGEDEAKKILDIFIDEKLAGYSEKRNDPNSDNLSNLSPYLHFGQISAQRIALEISKSKADAQGKEVFLEELVVRRELSDNFCFYNRNYDSYKGIPNWAKKTLEKHKNDIREYIYSLNELETGKTRDLLWNASQMEMVNTGKMHGYMRMYWAKKILEWSRDPEEAIETAISLNDKYSLDGRDPSGYVGILWSIGGLHDRPWFERPVFGSVRYMSYNGCKNKFDVGKYINKHLNK